LKARVLSSHSTSINSLVGKMRNFEAFQKPGKFKHSKESELEKSGQTFVLFLHKTHCWKLPAGHREGVF